ncbi:MAG: hypothetical protein IT463_13875 [Planctomycetes bacterium]|nr:hypothetical protein [Planctomycetota bacterium]
MNMLPDAETPADPKDWLRLAAVVCLVGAGLAAALSMDAGCTVREKGDEAGAEYDPLAYAYANPAVANPEATVPAMCYTKTGGTSNPCWVCHTDSRSPNEQSDRDLQESYSFSEFALTNHWDNVFADWRPAMASITDEQALAYARTDNYTPLRRALEGIKDYPGYRPDLDLGAGFDADGFAMDGSGWRALRYKPFPGAFWPTNGSTDDVFIRLPARFAQDSAGQPSRAVAKLNYAILEAAICADPLVPNHENHLLARSVEPVDEAAGDLDLDRNGTVSGTVTVINGMPARFTGAAAVVALERYKYPEGTEFLHSVRYVDPDAPGMIATHMKELRYSRKVRYLDAWGMQRAYEKEFNEKQEGVLPLFAGGPEVGLVNAFGWQLQGFIEDARGRLRLQTRQEHYFCMGCHSSIGVTVDQTFSFARKLPGKAGWAYQSVSGMHDAPQAGHADPEILTCFRRVRGGDEFRGNDELLARFFPGGVLDEAEVRRAAKGGDKDVAWLLAPSRSRALALNKACMALVREQRLDLGRDAMLAPAVNVHQNITNGSTDLGTAGHVFSDGRLWLDWSR